MISIEPTLKPVALSKLHPTQMTVGRAEVDEKVLELKELFKKSNAATRLGAHQVPGVLGPNGVFYLIDHHHLCMALLLVEQPTVLTRLVADLSYLDKRNFWNVLDARGWCHPYDNQGHRKSVKKIPRRVIEMVDDPYRSLAGFVRNEGGYAKNDTPFSEFQWADFLRGVMPQFERITPADSEHWDHAIHAGVEAARSHGARYLPGWCGVH